jgi:hypothetical protein
MRLSLLIAKLFVIAVFLAFFVVFAVKDYMNGYSGVQKSPITIEALAMLGIFLTISSVIYGPLKIWK